MGMSRVFWDSNLFIYLLEDFGQFNERVVELRNRMVQRGDELVTSTFTLGEVLVKPIEMRRPSLRAEYENTLQTICRMIPFDAEAAKIYASIRQDRTLKAPDAIQLACAAQARCDLFITNDDRLSGKIVPGIQFVTSLQRAPL
jgi:predicted nucleic acid-binding protein